MNLINPIPFGSSAEGGNVLMLALSRLSLYLKNETDLRAQVLQVAKRHRAAGAFEALSSLHLEPDASDQEIRRILEKARYALGEVLDDVLTIPADWILPGIDDFDAPINWSGRVCRTSLQRSIGLWAEQ